MADTKLADYPARLGDKQLVVVDHTGPASYVQGGETVGQINNQTGISIQGLSSIDIIIGSGASSLSGLYLVSAAPTGLGSRKTWTLKWLYSGSAGQGVDGVVIATAGTGQTNGTFTATANTGTATISYTIAGGLLTAARVLNPGGPYTAAPTFTIAQGGTPGTVTAFVGQINGTEVAPGINLSGETVRLGYIGR